MSHVDWVPAESPSSPPPATTLEWLEAQVGAEVASFEPLVGGLSSAVHRIIFDGRNDAAILRRYTLADWLEREPNIPHDEVRNLTLLEQLDVGVQTPELVASDPDGAACDVPALAMTEVGGRPAIDPEVPHTWAEKLAVCLARMHETPAVDGLPSYRRWDNPAQPLPSWTAEPGAWKRAKRLVAGELPAHPRVFSHRDFHPNNIHWDQGEICAVVDWLGACNGPIAGDLAHCRWNIAILATPGTADHFMDHYRLLTGYSEDVLAYDLSTVLSGPVGPFPTHAWNALGREDLTSESVAKLIDQWMLHLLQTS